VKHVEITKEGSDDTRWLHKLRKKLYIKKNPIYFALLVHRQEYRISVQLSTEQFIFVLLTNSVKYIEFFYIQILFQLVKPPSDEAVLRIRKGH
jgi:hypothetical protein